MSRTRRLPLALLAASAFTTVHAAAPAGIAVEELTIDGLHAAIRSGQTTCRQVVESFLARAKAYNGICTALVTADGKPVPVLRGYVRTGQALKFPTATVPVKQVLPDLANYKGLPLEYGEMVRTVSDPSVYTQYGMRVGMPDAGQLNALETLNIRGERSVTCKGAFDAHPSTGPLPAGAPAECERLRRQPDALERAAELDREFGRNPDLQKMPLYCVIATLKDPFDTQDMRTTSNSDVNFAMDVPPADGAIAHRLREKGAILYAKTVAHEFNAGPGNPGGDAKPKTNLVNGGQTMGAWGGQACNPYDTERVSRGSSGGSGVAVGANLAMIGICEQTGASCQGPASRNGIATLLTTKGLMPDGGGIGNQWFVDRAGIHARTLGDAAKVLDAMKDPATGFFDSRDPFTAMPSALVPTAPYASFIASAPAAGAKPLAGVRIALLREHFAAPTRNHETISAQIDREAKRVLRDQLGAELVEVRSPDYPDDPDVPDLKFTFNDALAELLPRLMPEMFRRRDARGNLWFDVPGHDVTSYDYLLKLSTHRAPLTPRIEMGNFATFGAVPCHNANCNDVMFDIDRYLAARGDARIRSWGDWVANARFRQDASRVGAENWLKFQGHLDEGRADRLARSHVARLALERVMAENGIAAFVHPENTVPTPKILGPNVGEASLDGITPFFQIPRVVVPAGFNDVIYEPAYALNRAGTDYESVLPEGTKPTKMPHPMPVSITFFAGQGDEPTLIRIGTAYEAATHHRAPPPMFGAVKR